MEIPWIWGGENLSFLSIDERKEDLG